MFIGLVNLVYCSNLANSMLNYVNKIRRDNGLDPFVSIHNLEGAAKDQALYMCENAKLTHENRLGKLESRLLKNGFKGSDFGENIAKYRSDMFEPIINVWLGSPAHKKYILGDFKYSGIATCLDRHGNRYWVQVYAMPSKQATSDEDSVESDKRNKKFPIDRRTGDDNIISSAVTSDINDIIEISDDKEEIDLKTITRPSPPRMTPSRITSTQTVFIVTKSVSLPDSNKPDVEYKTIDSGPYTYSRMDRKASTLVKPKEECNEIPLKTSQIIKTKTITITTKSQPVSSIIIPKTTEVVTTKTITMTERLSLTSTEPAHTFTTSQMRTKTVTITETLNQTRTIIDSIRVEPLSFTTTRSIMVFKTVTEKEPLTTIEAPVKTLTKIEEAPNTVTSTLFRTVEITKTPTSTIVESLEQNNKEDSNIILLVNIPKENTLKGKSVEPLKYLTQNFTKRALDPEIKNEENLKRLRKDKNKSNKQYLGKKSNELGRRPSSKSYTKSRSYDEFDDLSEEFENDLKSKKSHKPQNSNQRRNNKKSKDQDLESEFLDQISQTRNAKVNSFSYSENSDDNDQDEKNDTQFRKTGADDEDGFNISINVLPNKKRIRRKRKSL